MKEHPAVFIRFFIKPFFLQKANSLDSSLFDTISVSYTHLTLPTT